MGASAGSKTAGGSTAGAPAWVFVFIMLVIVALVGGALYLKYRVMTDAIDTGHTGIAEGIIGADLVGDLLASR
jgi:hypothetical protein